MSSTQNFSWNDLVAISDIPAVHEALENFSHDSTEENAVCLISEVVYAAANLTPVWTPVSDVSQVPEGVWLVKMEKKLLGSLVHVANVHPNVTSIGGCFSFDAPRVIAYRPIP